MDQQQPNDILEQLNLLQSRDLKKAPSNTSRKRKRPPFELNWLKKSIMFELPYQSTLKLRHNLDVIHIEKNVCDNIIMTLLDIEETVKKN